MTPSKSPLEFLLLAGLVVLAAGWVNWAWARKIGSVVLKILVFWSSKLRENLRPAGFVHAVLLVGVLIWVWTRYREDRHAIVILLEVAGITLLAAEVWAAQKLEESNRELRLALAADRKIIASWKRLARWLQNRFPTEYDYILGELKKREDDSRTALARWEKTEKHTAAFRRLRLWTGASLLIAAALLGMFKAHEEVPPPPPPPPPIEDEIKVGLRLPPALKLPSFVSGSAELTADITNAICRYREANKAEWESAIAIVVGRHDKTELSARARAQFTSNASLAEQRALAVHQALNDPLLCGPERAIAAKVSVLQLDSPPRHAGHQASEGELAEDRRVELYLLTATSRRIPRGVETRR